mmetsp:Transcript_19477/g.26743  ORF Transcript_19477/g.26743 Transcript_19477/m.26743 type:complete len:99 (-) Transcript_19477:1371-1667(-)
MSDLQNDVLQYKEIATVPHDPWEQLQMVIESVFCSWYFPRAVKNQDILQQCCPQPFRVKRRVSHRRSSLRNRPVQFPAQYLQSHQAVFPVKCRRQVLR